MGNSHVGKGLSAVQSLCLLASCLFCRLKWQKPCRAPCCTTCPDCTAASLHASLHAWGVQQYVEESVCRMATVLPTAPNMQLLIALCMINKYWCCLMCMCELDSRAQPPLDVAPCALIGLHIDFKERVVFHANAGQRNIRWACAVMTAVLASVQPRISTMQASTRLCLVILIKAFPE